MSEIAHNASFEKAPITITPQAVLKSWELISEMKKNAETELDIKLRVAVLGKEPSGLQYKFSFTEEVKSDDMIITETVQNPSNENNMKQVDWVIDTNSFQFFEAIEIDYEHELNGGRFIARNVAKAPITITPQAALKSWELISEMKKNAETELDIKLRVAVLGGGCHGFQYKFSFEETVKPDDVVITETIQTSPDENGMKQVDWVVGVISLQLLKGIEIDYKSDLTGERFVIRNLKVKSTCSCGHSFSADV